jgi:hypothetical protein
MSAAVCQQPQAISAAETLPGHPQQRHSQLCTREALSHDLWWAVVRALNNSGLPYCILGTPEPASYATESDLDFVVRPGDAHLVPQLLTAAAASAGGRLVQAIRHETTATYFALAAQRGEALGFLHPDCTTDYRRDGRLWLTAEELLANPIRTAAGFYRPAPDIDFNYYLVKQVLKQTLSHAQWRKLRALYCDSLRPADAWSAWPQSTRDEIDRALGQTNPVVFRNLLPRLRFELNRTAYRESAIARARSHIGEAARLLQRVTQPDRAACPDNRRQ